MLAKTEKMNIHACEKIQWVRIFLRNLFYRVKTPSCLKNNRCWDIGGNVVCRKPGKLQQKDASCERTNFGGRDLKDKIKTSFF